MFEAIRKLTGGRKKYGEPIVVVSGLPRSGTSMMMRMLEAGGVAIMSDGALPNRGSGYGMELASNHWAISRPKKPADPTVIFPEASPPSRVSMPRSIWWATTLRLTL